MHIGELAAHDGVTGIAVLVDDAIRAPGEVVAQRIRGVAREGAHTQLQVIELVKLPGQMPAQHADQSWGQSALRHQHRPRLGRQCADGAGGRHILGQIKIVHALLCRCRGHACRAEKGEGIDDKAVGGQRGGERRIVLDIQLQVTQQRIAVGRRRLDIRQRDRHLIQLGQHVGQGGADLSRAENQDVVCTHAHGRLLCCAAG